VIFTLVFNLETITDILTIRQQYKINDDLSDKNEE